MYNRVTVGEMRNLSNAVDDSRCDENADIAESRHDRSRKINGARH